MAEQQEQVGLRESATIAFPGTEVSGTAWDLYNRMIAGIHEGVLVRDYCLGLNWSYVEEDCGMGVAFTVRGGGKRAYRMDLRGMELRQVAELSKSWCFQEATLGIAALNAWYSRRELLAPLGCEFADPAEHHGEDERGGNGQKDAFCAYKPQIAAKGDANVVVVGHFPHVADIAEYANLTVLERNCRDGLDTPDPGCEYVMPQADYAFITGVTLINKTAPRLLELARNATTVMVGPSVVMTPALFERGVHELAGSVVNDPERAKFAVANGGGQLFGQALVMASLKAK